MSKRIEKINELLRQEISHLILKKVQFKEALITITRVETSADLRYAKVKISVLPNDKIDATFKLLDKNIFKMQQLLNKRLQIKPVPKIVFEIDKVEAKAQRIEKLLGEIKKQGQVAKQ